MDITQAVVVGIGFAVLAALFIFRPWKGLDLTSKEEVDDTIRPSHKDDFITGLDPVPGVVTVVNPKPSRVSKPRAKKPVEVDQCELTEVDEAVAVKKPRSRKVKQLL